MLEETVQKQYIRNIWEESASWSDAYARLQKKSRFRAIATLAAELENRTPFTSKRLAGALAKTGEANETSTKTTPQTAYEKTS
mgnify:CR=1 FL=1